MGGHVQINGGFTRLPSDVVTSRNRGTGSISVDGFKPFSDKENSVWRFTMSEGGIYNGDLELGTKAGFRLIAGTESNLEVTTAIAAHSGTHSLRLPGGGPNTLVSSGIPIKSTSSKFRMDVFFQNHNTSTANPRVDFMSPDGQIITPLTAFFSSNTTTWAKRTFSGQIPAGAAYARFYLDLGLTYSTYVYMDSFYVNQW